MIKKFGYMVTGLVTGSKQTHNQVKALCLKGSSRIGYVVTGLRVRVRTRNYFILSALLKIIIKKISCARAITHHTRNHVTNLTAARLRLVTGSKQTHNQNHKPITIDKKHQKQGQTMKKTLTQVTVDCLLAFYLNSAEQADAVLISSLDKVSHKNKKVLQQILERSQQQKNRYWYAIANELEHLALKDEHNVELLNPKPLAACLPSLRTVKQPIVFGV